MSVRKGTWVLRGLAFGRGQHQSDTHFGRLSLGGDGVHSGDDACARPGLYGIVGFLPVALFHRNRIEKH